MEEILNNIIDGGIDIGIKLIISILILIIGFKLTKVFINFIKKCKPFNKLNKNAKNLVTNSIKLLLNIILFLTILSYIGIPMTSIIALLGSIGLALGLALQGGLSNIAGGLMILIFKPFKVGDYIDTHTDAGTVVDINLFYTVIITLDNKKISLPNGSLSNTNIINFSAKEKRRLDLKYSISYNSDINKVKNIINKVLDKENLIKDEERLIRLGEYGDNALVIYVRVWVKSEDYFNIMFNINENIKEEFDKNKIEFPFPQIDIHMKK